MSGFLQFNPDEPTQAPPAAGGALSCGYATRAEWNKHHDTIKRLYVDEENTLTDVMEIMAREYAFRATRKMYKTRITKWKLDKKIKEPEARALLRIQARRELLGKGSAFRMRGKPVTVDDVLRYFKRKGIINPASEAQETGPPTPPTIEYWTPPATPKGDPNDEDEEIDDSPNSQMAEFDSFENIALSYMDDMDDNVLTPLNFDQGRYLLFSGSEFQSYEIPESPLPPQSFLVQERLLSSITVYFDGAFGNDLFVINPNGSIVTKGLPQSHCDLDFLKACDTGTLLMDRGFFVEGRRHLSKASSLIVPILRTQNLNAFESIFSALRFLSLRGYDEIATMFRNLMRDLASKCLPIGHPWIQILSQVSLLEDTVLVPNLLEAWRCVCNAISNSIGQFHPTSINSYSAFLSENGDANSLQVLQSFTSLVEETLDPDDIRLAHLRYSLGAALYRASRCHEAIRVLEKDLVYPFEGHTARVLALISYCWCRMGQYPEAESILRQALTIYERTSGSSHPRTLQYKLVLSGWLKDRGRDDEAAILDAEREEAMGPDEMELGY